MLHPHVEPMRRPRSPFVRPALELRQAPGLAVLQMSWPSSPLLVPIKALVAAGSPVLEFVRSLELVQLLDQFVPVRIRAR